MKKVFTILFTFCSLILFGQDVSESLAHKTADYYFQMFQSEKTNQNESVDSIVITNHKTAVTEQISPNGRANMWLVPVREGWILLSGSMKATPFLAYIPSFKKPVYDSMPPAAQELLDGYEDYIDYINNDPSKNEIDSRWSEVLNCSAKEKEIANNRIVTTTQVGPLLSVHWNQAGGGTCSSNKIYNKFFPVVDNPSTCDKAYTGCVAVAIAQIMWYWNWPYAAQIPQTIGGNDTILTFYDWSKMPTFINNNTDMDEVDMVAGFLRDCGYKLDMDYGADGSSSSINAALDALIAFGYDKNSMDLRSKISTSGWTSMLRTNIDDGQPVYYRGRNQAVGGNGHAFVVDGYISGNNPIYHINFGHGINGADGWYNIDDSIPYTHYQKAIFGIRPDPKYCADTTILTVESPKFCIAQAGTVTLNGVHMNNISEGRVYSSESITLTNGTYIPSGCNVIFDIKPVPCTSVPEIMNITNNSREQNNDIHYVPLNPKSSDTPPAYRKIFRDGQIYILRGDHTYTLTGQEVE